MAYDRRTDEQLVSTRSISTLSKVAVAAVKRWYQARPLPSVGPDGRRTPSFAEHPLYRGIAKYRDYQKIFDLTDPFFQVHQQRSGAEALIGNMTCANFASYDYLGLNQDPEVGEAARQAIARFGTSVSASRLVAGERPLHGELEASLARFYDTEASLVYVSGHATNVSAIATIVGEKDIIFHDEFIHNSASTGAKLSGAKIVDLPSQRLGRPRPQAGRASRRPQVRARPHRGSVLDGRRHPRSAPVHRGQAQAWRLADGRRGSLASAFSAKRATAWRSTGASTRVKSTSGWARCRRRCRPAAATSAGKKELIEVLKFRSPGFVYSVGLPAASTAAALKSIEVLERSPEKVKRLQENGRFFLKECKALGLEVGSSEGFAVVPIIVGDAVIAIRLTERLLRHGVNALPIIYPAVPLKTDRVRFFITSEHTREQLLHAARVTREQLDGLAGMGNRGPRKAGAI